MIVPPIGGVEHDPPGELGAVLVDATKPKRNVKVAPALGWGETARVARHVL